MSEILLGPQVAARLAENDGFNAVMTAAGPVPLRTWAEASLPGRFVTVVDVGGALALEERRPDGSIPQAAGRWPLLREQIGGTARST